MRSAIDVTVLAKAPQLFLSASQCVEYLGWFPEPWMVAYEFCLVQSVSLRSPSKPCHAFTEVFSDGFVTLFTFLLSEQQELIRKEMKITADSGPCSLALSFWADACLSLSHVQLIPSMEERVKPRGRRLS